MFIVDQGGTFLYVATVLQPVSHHSAAAADINPLTRVLHITAGIFIPYGLSTFLGHGH
jgi:zinc transporter 9